MNRIIFEDLEKICKNDVIRWNVFNKKTFLITGSTGLIGSLLVKALAFVSEKKKLNLIIYAHTRSKNKAKKIFSDIYPNNLKSVTLSIITGDIRKIKINQPIDYIVHGANPTESKFFINNPVETIDILFSGTKRVLEIAKNNTVKKMVYLSSMEIYGENILKKKKTEENDLGYINILSTRSSYSEGKRICECLCSSYASEYKTEVCIARLSQTFGAGVSINDNRIFCQLAKSVIKNEDIILHTKGKSEGNYVYTSDAIIAILILLQKGNKGEAYNIANENNHSSIYKLANLVKKEIACEDIKIIFDIPENNKYGYAPDVKMKLSSEKMRLLGWRPETGLKESFKRMIEGSKLQE